MEPKPELVLNSQLIKMVDVLPTTPACAIVEKRSLSLLQMRPALVNLNC